MQRKGRVPNELSYKTGREEEWLTWSAGAPLFLLILLLGLSVFFFFVILPCVTVLSLEKPPSLFLFVVFFVPPVQCARPPCVFHVLCPPFPHGFSLVICFSLFFLVFSLPLCYLFVFLCFCFSWVPLLFCSSLCIVLCLCVISSLRFLVSLPLVSFSLHRFFVFSTSLVSGLSLAFIRSENAMRSCLGNGTHRGGEG